MPTIDMSNDTQLLQIVENKNLAEEYLRTIQAGTAVIAKTTEIVSQAPVTIEEYTVAATAVSRARDREDAARQTLITRSVGLVNPVKEITNNSDVKSNVVDLTVAAQHLQESDVKREVENYVSQVQSGNIGIVDNGDRVRQSIVERMGDETISLEERNQLQDTLNIVDGINNTVNSNPDIAAKKDAYINSKENAIEAESERNTAENIIRDLNTKPGADEAKAALDSATLQTVQSVRDSIPVEEIRASDNPDARALRTTNKLLIDSFSGSKNQAPFYLQLPTLKAITDFRLRNGFSPYGSANPSEIARDAVHFNIFKGALGKTEIVDIEGTNLKTSVMKDISETTMGSFTIYPNNPDWLTFNHNHNYSDENPISSMVNPVLQVVNTLSNVSKGIQNIASNEPTSARASRRLDFIDQYQNTEKLSFTIPFILFTKSNFIEDIYVPLMFLTALSYPSRIPNGQIGSDLKGALDALNADQISDFVQKYGDNAEQLLQTYGNIGAFRYIIAERPEYISVRHASGLFFLKLASIVNFSYTYKGPWINSRGEVVPEGLGGTRLNEYLWNMQIRNNKREKMPYAFPSIAECSLTIKSVEPLFRNDWLNLLGGATDSSGRGIVRVSEQNTGSIGKNGKRQDFTNLDTTRTRLAENNAARNQNNPK